MAQHQLHHKPDPQNARPAIPIQIHTSDTNGGPKMDQRTRLPTTNKLRNLPLARLHGPHRHALPSKHDPDPLGAGKSSLAPPRRLVAKHQPRNNTRGGMHHHSSPKKRSDSKKSRTTTTAPAQSPNPTPATTNIRNGPPGLGPKMR